MSESISNERLSKRNLWGYSMGGIGRDMAYQLVNTYLLTFITFTKGLSNTEFVQAAVGNDKRAGATFFFLDPFGKLFD